MPFTPVTERVAVKTVPADAVERVRRELSVSPVVATILAGRGLTDYETCRRYFNPDPANLHDPFLFGAMGKAVERIGRAIDSGEKITIYGDYDVDGITATVLLKRVLDALGADCSWYLPNRLVEGYGISADGIESIAAGGTRLVISVDCGVTACDQVEAARLRGVDVIVTDHHEPKWKLPAAFAIINPKVEGCGYPDTTLAGVGVALKLCQALCTARGAPDRLWKERFDLAAVGTAADIVPLTGENRIIVSHGFALLADRPLAGFAALLELQGLKGRRLSTHDVVFQIAPCINAVGRLGDASAGVRLLLCDDPAAAMPLAQVLVDANRERRAIHEQVAGDACAWVQATCEPERDFALVAGERHWHAGVIGIVASKLVERFYRPAILMSIGDDGMARGSGRSIKGVHLLETLDECADLLEGYGGHAAAAGLTIRADRIAQLRDRLNEAVRRQLDGVELRPVVEADAAVRLEQLSTGLLRTIERMAPFGPGNMRPVLYCGGLSHRYPPRVVGSNHLKMNVSRNGTGMDAIGFNFGARQAELARARSFGLAFTLDENVYNGKTSLQMKIKGVDL